MTAPVLSSRRRIWSFLCAFVLLFTWCVNITILRVSVPIWISRWWDSFASLLADRFYIKYSILRYILYDSMFIPDHSSFPFLVLQTLPSFSEYLSIVIHSDPFHLWSFLHWSFCSILIPSIPPYAWWWCYIMNHLECFTVRWKKHLRILCQYGPCLELYGVYVEGTFFIRILAFFSVMNFQCFVRVWQRRVLLPWLVEELCWCSWTVCKVGV